MTITTKKTWGGPTVAGKTSKRKSESRDAVDAGAWSGTPIRGLIPLVVLLVAWELLGDGKSPSFPSPDTWYTAILPLVTDGSLWIGLLWTALTFVAGLAIATLIGGIVGSLMGASRWADKTLGPLVDFARSTPAAAIVPVAALVLGYNLEMKLFVVVIPALWPVLLTCRAARKGMSQVLLDTPKTLRLTRPESIWKVTMPSLARAALLGVRVAAPLALIMTLLVEIVTGINGVGALLGTAQANYQSARVYGLLVVTAVLAFLVNWVITRLDGMVAGRLGEVTRGGAKSKAQNADV